MKGKRKYLSFKIKKKKKTGNFFFNFADLVEKKFDFFYLNFYFFFSRFQTFLKQKTAN